MQLRGRVDGNVEAGDVVPLAGIRVLAREVDLSEAPQFHADPDRDVVVAETITSHDGRYAIDVPTGWASVVFEGEGWTRTYRTLSTGLDDERWLDVDLWPAPRPLEFEMPQDGEPDVILGFDSDAGREYAKLRIEPGDLVAADGRPVTGRVTARIDAPHPRDRHKDSLLASNLVATRYGAKPFEPFGLVSVDLEVGGERVAVAPGRTLLWEVKVAAEQLESAKAAAKAGALHNYSLDTRMGLWVEDAADVELVDGTIRVERSHFSAGALGTTQDTTPAAKTLCADPGRHAVILLTFSNPRTPPAVAETLVKSTLSYVSQVESPRVLVVLDDDHHDEFTQDAAYIQSVIQSEGFAADRITEPTNGLTESHVEGYDVVWLTNPGYPIDDPLTLETLSSFREAGGGFVLSGDDMTQNTVNGNVSTTPYTFLQYVANGTSTCGKPTDNNTGSDYRVTFRTNTGHPMAAELEGATFLYGDDIDHSTPVGDGEHVLAWAELEGEPSCTVRVPVVMALDLDDSSVRPECSCSEDAECLGAQHCVGNTCESCTILGDACATDEQCCGALTCNGGVCGEPCASEGASCLAGGTCCGTLACTGGTCSICEPEGASCSSSADCCGELACLGGVCSPCRTLGEQCDAAGDCCGTAACEETVTFEDIVDETCAGARELVARVRDFRQSHADFQYKIASDLGIVRNVLGADGKPVYMGDPVTPTTNGKAAFDQWFRDVDGVNLPMDVTLVLDEVSPGVYQYRNNAFFPIDGMGFGNEGNEHNYHFTLELHTSFVYRGGETFTFTGDDDLFTFINGKLAIDLGGVHSSLSRTVDLDQAAPSLGLQVGQVYSLDIFFAERHTTASNFRIDTTIACLSNTKTVPVVTGQCTPPDDVPEEPPSDDDGGTTGGDAYEDTELPPIPDLPD